MTCRERFYIQSEVSISQLWNTVGKIKVSYYYAHQTLIIQNLNNVTLE